MKQWVLSNADGRLIITMIGIGLFGLKQNLISSHNNSYVVCEIARYFTEDQDTISCFLLLNVTRLSSINVKYPVVDFLSPLSCTYSTYEKTNI